MEQYIEQYFDNLKAEALAKFRKGRKEHGEDFASIQFDKEIKLEALDILIYLAMKEHINNGR